MSEQTDTSESAKQYVRDLIARDYPWAKTDPEDGMPEDVIEFSYHDLLAAFDAGAAVHTQSLVDGAGDLVERLFKRTIITYCEDGSTIGYEPPAIQQEAAATIAALMAENERLAEREAQARIEGVRAGIEAAGQRVLNCALYDSSERLLNSDPRVTCSQAARALNPAAIAKGV